MKTPVPDLLDVAIGLVIVLFVALVVALWPTGDWSGRQAAEQAIERSGHEVSALACDQRGDVATCAAILDGTLAVTMRCREDLGCVFLVSTEVGE